MITGETGRRFKEEKKILKQRYSRILNVDNIQDILDMGFVIIEVDVEYEAVVSTEASRVYPTYTITFQEV